MARTGRPTGYKSKFHCKSVIEKSEVGKAIAEICADWNISRETYYDWMSKHKDFSDACKKADQKREQWWIKLGYTGALGRKTQEGNYVNLGFYVWLTKNILKWSDRTEAQISQDTPTINLNYSLTSKDTSGVK